MRETDKRKTMTLEEITLAYLSVKGTANAPRAFNELESKLASLKGRKFFGYFDPETDEYRACVALNKGEALTGSSTWTIPPGRYCYETIEDWSSNIASIGPRFNKMIKENSERFDPSRPCLEYYRSMSELRILVPVR
jgi:hypothetical protein